MAITETDVRVLLERVELVAYRLARTGAELMELDAMVRKLVAEADCVSPRS